VTADHTIMRVQYSTGVTIMTVCVKASVSNVLCLEHREIVFVLIHECLPTITWNYAMFCHNF